MSQRKDWENEWRNAFQQKSGSPHPQPLPEADAFSPSPLKHMLERAFKGYSIVFEGSSIMPAASFMRMALDCFFIDDRFTQKHLRTIISKHAGQSVSPKSRPKGTFGLLFQDGSVEGCAALAFADFLRALQDIATAKHGPGKNGLHRLFYLNIIRFANLEKQAEPFSSNIVSPRTSASTQQSQDDPFLRLEAYTEMATAKTRELRNSNSSKWLENPKTGKEIYLLKKYFAHVFTDVFEAFVFFDINGNDTLTMNETRRGIERLKVPDIDIDRIMREIDNGCLRRHEGICLSDFIRIFAWHPAGDSTEWREKYERTKLAAGSIAARTRCLIRKYSTPALPSEVDLDLITACSVLGTRWEEVRKSIHSMPQPVSSKNRSTPSPPRTRRSLSPHQLGNGNARTEHRASSTRASGNVESTVNAIERQDFSDMVLSIPLDLTSVQVHKVFDFLDSNKNGWFHILQAEDVLHKAGYLSRVTTTTKSSSTTFKRSQESVLHEIKSAERERNLALSALADKWAFQEIDLVHRHKDNLKNVSTLEEQIRVERATASAQKALTNAMEKEFSAIHNMFDERVKSLRKQLGTSAKTSPDGRINNSHPETSPPLHMSVEISISSDDAGIKDDRGNVQLQTSSSSQRGPGQWARSPTRSSPSPVRAACDKRNRNRIIEGAPSHSLQQTLRRKMRNCSSLKAPDWADLLKQFDRDRDGVLTYDEIFQAVQQACDHASRKKHRESAQSSERAEKREPTRNKTKEKESGRARGRERERGSERQRESEGITAEVLSPILRILDHERSGKIRLDGFVDFVWEGARKIPSPSLTATHWTSLEKKNLFTKDGPSREPDPPLAKTLDPRACQNQLSNVFVNDSPTKQVAFAETDKCASKVVSTRKSAAVSSGRSKSAPPRSNHIQRSQPMHFAKNAPGACFRPPSPPKAPRTSPAKTWGQLFRNADQDPEQNILMWLQQQAQETVGAEVDSGILGYHNEGQPSSPRALSQKSAQQSPNIFMAETRSATRSAPRRTQPHSQVGWPQFEHSTISRIDSNDTNGWIVSPAPPSPPKGTPSSNALNLATNNCNLSPARYTRGWPRVFLEKPLTIPLVCKPIVRNARSVSPKDSSSDEGRAQSPKPAKKGQQDGYHEIQDKIRASLRKEWAKSDSESDDGFESSFKDAVLQKQISRKSNTTSPYGKKSALELVTGGSPSAPSHSSVATLPSADTLRPSHAHDKSSPSADMSRQDLVHTPKAGAQRSGRDSTKFESASHKWKPIQAEARRSQDLSTIANHTQTSSLSEKHPKTPAVEKPKHLPSRSSKWASQKKLSDQLNALFWEKSELSD